VKVDFWSIWDIESNKHGKYFKGIVDEFNKANPDVVVTMSGQGGYDGLATKLEAAILAKNIPTIAQIEESFLARFHVRAADLGKYLDKKTIDNYNPGLLRSSYANGVLKAVPINRSTPILYVNVDLLQKAGLDPKGPKTWDELVQFAAKIHALGPDIYGFTGYWDTDAWYWESNLYAYGGEVVSADGTKVAFNNEKGWKIVELWQKMVRDGTMLNPYGVQEGKSGFMLAKFGDGKVGMVLDSIGSLTSLVRNPKYNIKVSSVFQPAGEKYAVVSGGANLIVMNDSTEAQKKAAGRFLTYIAQDRIAVDYFNLSGYFPTTKSSLETPEIKQLFEQFPQYKVPMDQMQYIHSRPWHKNWREMYIAITEELEAALLKPDKDPKEVMAAAAARCQKILDENK